MILGIALGWAGSAVLLVGALETAVVLVVPWVQVLVVLGVAVVAALLAAVGPARRLSRVAPASALASA